MAITRVGGSWIHKYVSLVADDVTHTYTRAAKPELNLPNGSRCFEMDSDTEYIYDRENDAWEVYVPSSGGGGTTNYSQLSNKPSINNVELSGNKTLAALGINAGSIGFDETETYTDGSVGKEVSDAKNAISQNEESIADTQSMMATVEATATASKNYAVGDLLVYDGKLYEVTSAIATGATIIVGSNVTQTTVEDQLGSGGAVDDVQINGTSIVQDGVANIPVLGNDVNRAVKTRGIPVIKDGYCFGFRTFLSDGDYCLAVKSSTEWGIQAGLGQNSNGYGVVDPTNVNAAAFYGLAKAAGDSTQSASANPVGTYTEEAKSAIRNMLGVPEGGGMSIVTLSGTQITQNAADNTFYVCGELTELTFTTPSVGITMIRFTSGTTPTVCSFPSVTSWMGGFNPTTDIEANKTYDINVLNGIGVAGWV